MYKIALIGAGQLGSRHLQGIAQSSFDIAVEVVEPLEATRTVARERYAQVENNMHVRNIVFHSSIEKISDTLDLVIIATGAEVRAKVIKELLGSKRVQNLILEKVLFQTMAEYDEVEVLLKQKGTNCWVNHPRRMYPFYQSLKGMLHDSRQISYSVQGGDWGLGCSGLHFIDNLSFLVGSSNLTVDGALLDNVICSSKREGFIEFSGLLVGAIDQHSFSLHSNKYGAAMLTSIVSDRIAVKIDEARGEVEVAKIEENWEWRKYQEKIVYLQSELTQIILQDILLNETTLLPTYAEASALHKPFILTLLEKMEYLTGERHTRCMIT